MCTRSPSRSSSDGGLPLSNALVRAAVGSAPSMFASVLASEDTAEKSTREKLCSVLGSVVLILPSTSPAALFSRYIYALVSDKKLLFVPQSRTFLYPTCISFLLISFYDLEHLIFTGLIGQVLQDHLSNISFCVHRRCTCLLLEMNTAKYRQCSED